MVYLRKVIEQLVQYNEEWTIFKDTSIQLIYDIDKKEPNNLFLSICLSEIRGSISMKINIETSLILEFYPYIENGQVWFNGYTNIKLLKRNKYFLPQVSINQNKKITDLYITSKSTPYFNIVQKYDIRNYELSQQYLIGNDKKIIPYFPLKNNILEKMKNTDIYGYYFKEQNNKLIPLKYVLGYTIYNPEYPKIFNKYINLD